jgi:hypothetical protein
MKRKKNKKNRNLQCIGLAMIIIIAIFLAYMFLTQSYGQVQLSVLVPETTPGVTPISGEMGGGIATLES